MKFRKHGLKYVRENNKNKKAYGPTQPRGPRTYQYGHQCLKRSINNFVTHKVYYRLREFVKLDFMTI